MTGSSLGFGAGDDVLNMVTGAVITGQVEAGGGTNTLNLSGSGSGDIRGETELTGSKVTFAGFDGFNIVNVNSGSWTLYGGGYYDKLNIAAGATFTVDDTHSAAHGSPSDGGLGPLNANITITNNGVLVLRTAGASNALFFDPTLTINTAAQGGPFTYSGNGTLEFSGTNVLAPTETWVASGQVVAADGLSVVLGAISGNVTIQSGATVQIGGGGVAFTNGFNGVAYLDPGNTGTIQGGIADNGTLTISRLDDYALAGALTGAGSVIVKGPGALTIGASANFTGNVEIQAGSLSNAGTIGSVTADSSGVILTNSGTISGSVHLGGGGDIVNIGASSIIGGTVDGGAGSDTVVFSHASSQYSVVSQSDGTVVVQDLSNPTTAGRVVLANVETIKFTDVTASSTAALSSAPVQADILSLTRASALNPVNQTLASTVASSLAAGQTETQVLPTILKAAANTSSVATMAYQFFTGGAPSSGGMDYLVSPTGPNPNNLNSAYYQFFNIENRYINFAVNLGKVGAGQAAFTAAYGNLSLFDATKLAYGTIFGVTPSDTKVHALLDPNVSANTTRADYFAYYGGDGANGIGTKAAMVGWLLAEAVLADVGSYAKSNDAFLTDIALHNAAWGVDVIGHYNQGSFAFNGG